MSGAVFLARYNDALMKITMWDTSKDEAGVLSEHESGSLNPSLWCQRQLIFNSVVSMDHINRQINLRIVNSSLSDHFIGIKSTDTKQYFLLVGNKVPSWSLDETHFLYIVNILSIDQQTYQSNFKKIDYSSFKLVVSNQG